MTEDILKLRVEEIKWETPDTATFYLSEVSGQSIIYKAGQFLTLIFNHGNEEIRRSYSLSSSPDEDQLAITIKRITNGEISRFMLTKMKPGNVLNALAPTGRFTISNYQHEKDILLFAGGTGITPIFSQIKYVLNRPGKSRLTLIYSNQNAGSVLFKEELIKLEAKNPGRFKIIHLLSSEANRLNPDKVEQLTRKIVKGDLTSAEFYLCGPFSYMRMIRFDLVFMGVLPRQIRRENFVIETVTVTGTSINFPPRNIKIKFRNELHDFVVGENQSILQAALQNGISLPYSCRNGVCSSCAAKCVSGKIEMVKNDVLTDTDIADGWILTCTGHPVSGDVVVTFGE
ncbi:ring-1,2-phenylacetyl-CoA epoxidase subunit PaaE [Mucilaginibacter pineti]|uniref:Ring-1,2-phenylacetyl-CoA epoxidase subunit PaaE n=1 Tax=Mucilaginibacter pineti TaxID=1391627 RepID=A0A1G7DS53_9SPHI|nr:ferredoxin--NADP reductase [Mucilaginibacter pineti]SDE53990.1 ring-1,2-phenylacetyl-CoA epoxidase subunit PaaE [Mucilaginibacter pineti]